MSLKTIVLAVLSLMISAQAYSNPLVIEGAKFVGKKIVGKYLKDREHACASTYCPLVNFEGDEFVHIFKNNSVTPVVSHIVEDHRIGIKT